MKLIILNITPIDSIKVTNYLRKTAVYFIKVSSVGGVISSGNYTYLIKLNEEQLDEIVSNITVKIVNNTLLKKSFHVEQLKEVFYRKKMNTAWWLS